jgi:hypothetical protein
LWNECNLLLLFSFFLFECLDCVCQEKPALDLAFQIARFADILQLCLKFYEPSTLVNYLFELAAAISCSYQLFLISSANYSRPFIGYFLSRSFYYIVICISPLNCCNWHVFETVAHQHLRVKGQEMNLAKARKLLFWSARVVLATGLTLLGLTPETRMWLNNFSHIQSLFLFLFLFLSKEGIINFCLYVHAMNESNSKIKQLIKNLRSSSLSNFRCLDTTSKRLEIFYNHWYEWKLESCIIKNENLP